MIVINQTTSPRSFFEPNVRSKHDVFRDKQRRRERLHASLVAQARKAWRWAGQSESMQTLAVR